ncbi:MAG: transporter [Gemmatimonadetes bacterium]|jgi:ABC-2 type transport system ATP-binding protein|nr:transporter [Gemmatimonadota bacterium]
MFACSGISKQFGPTTALRDAGFMVSPGEVLGVIGPNGSGKSTLLACAAGLLRADTGTVTLNEVPLDLVAIRRTVFFLPDGITPWAEHRVHDVVATWRRLQGRSAEEARGRIAALSLDGLLGRLVRELSKGERKRLMLALALLATQPVLLLDEPFDGLDLRQTREVASLLRAEAAARRAIVLSLHQLGDAERTCDRLALLDAGRIVAEGSLETLRSAAGRPGAPLDEVFLALT